MRLTRGIAVCALGLAIMLAIGAVTPYQPFASAGSPQPIFSNAPEHIVPTPALPTAAPVVEQPAAPVVEQPAAPTPQVIYIQLPAAPPPQVIYIQPAALVVEQPAALVVDQSAAPVVEPAAAPQVEPAAVDYQQRRLDAINSGAAYRPRTR